MTPHNIKMFLSLSKFVFLLGAVAGNDNNIQYIIQHRSDLVININTGNTRTKRQSPQSGDGKNNEMILII